MPRREIRDWSNGFRLVLLRAAFDILRNGLTNRLFYADFSNGSASRCRFAFLISVGLAP